jgi:hypothetical protein
MSARDAESGSSTYKGGSGRAGGLGNGGIGGGMGGGGNFGGGMGGGGGRMGGIGNRTGLTTGNSMWGIAGRNGVTFTGRPGGFAQQPGAFGFRPEAGVTRGPLKQPKGLLGNPTPASVAGVNPVPENVMAVEDVPMPTFEDPMAMYTTLKPLKTPSVQGWLPSWPGTGQWWGNEPRFMNNNGLSRGRGAAHGSEMFKQGYDYGIGDGFDPSRFGNKFNGPGSTYTQNGNTVNQNGMGAVRSGLRGNGGR